MLARRLGGPDRTVLDEAAPVAYLIRCPPGRVRIVVRSSRRYSLTLTMDVLTEGVDPNEFFEELRAASRSVLMLDYDGTLAPFREDRDRAVPYPGVRRRLERLLRRDPVRVVLISGRPVRDVLRLVDLDEGVEVWGTHGWERRRADGSYEPPDLPEALRDALEAAERFLKDELAIGRRCERKPASVAFHVRSVPEAQARDELRRVREGWASLEGQDGLTIEEFDGGIELRLQGRDKGDAVEEILAEAPADASCAYLGDDWTDEDAFRALEDRGLRVLVRSTMRETVADLRLEPPEELLEFLDRWEAATD